MGKINNRHKSVGNNSNKEANIMAYIRGDHLCHLFILWHKLGNL